MRRLLLACGLCLLPALAAAQITYPLTLQVTWDPNPAAETVTGYIVTVNGTNSTVQPTACTATACSMTFSVPAAGPHTVSVAAVNQWGTGTPTAVTFTIVVPGKSNNVQVRKP